MQKKGRGLGGGGGWCGGVGGSGGGGRMDFECFTQRVKHVHYIINLLKDLKMNIPYFKMPKYIQFSSA